MSKLNKSLTLLNLVLVGFLPIWWFVSRFTSVVLYGLFMSDILSYSLPFWHNNNLLILLCLFVSLICFIKTLQMIIKHDTTKKLLGRNRWTHSGAFDNIDISVVEKATDALTEINQSIID